jgi:hypothetical protein
MAQEWPTCGLRGCERPVHTSVAGQLDYSLGVCSTHASWEFLHSASLLEQNDVLSLVFTHHLSHFREELRYKALQARTIPEISIPDVLNTLRECGDDWQQVFFSSL